MMDTATAAGVVRGRLYGGNVRFARVTTDTRALAPGDLFVALKGEQFDGHDFVPAAFARGAVAALVAADRADALAGELIAVADPLAALGQLARHWRAQFTLPVVVIAGSNGKTTVKEMVASILRAEFGAGAVHATVHGAGGGRGIHHPPLRALSAAAATRTSEKGRRTPSRS